MAVNGNLLVYPDQELTPQDFAIMMERISVIRSGVISGCTIAFDSTDQNILNVESGYAFVRGRLVKVNNGTLDTSLLSLSAESWFVYVRVHLNDVDPLVEDLCTVFVTDTVPSDSTTEFNEHNTGIAYATLATIDVSNREVNQTLIPEIGTVKTYILRHDGWEEEYSENSTRIMVYRLTDPMFSENAHIDIVPRTVGFDRGYLKMLQTANIQVFSISEGILTLGSYGVLIPDSDIEIGIIFRGEI